MIWMQNANSITSYPSYLRVINHNAGGDFDQLLTDTSIQTFDISPEYKWKLQEIIQKVAPVEYAMPVKYQLFNNQITVWVTNKKFYNPFGGPAIEIKIGTTEKYFYLDENMNVYNITGGPSMILNYTTWYREEWTTGNNKKIKDNTITYFNIDVSTGTNDSDHNSLFQWLKGIKVPLPASLMKITEERYCTHIADNTFLHVINGSVYNSDFAVDIKGNTTYNKYILEKTLTWETDDLTVTRLDGPASITLDRVKETYKNGKLVSMTYGNWARFWYVNGKKITETKLNEWAKKNNIVVKSGPCLDESAFTNAKDQMQFMIDFS